MAGEIRLSAARCAGACHGFQHCEDAVATLTHQGVSVVVLCDGAGGLMAGRQIAEDLAPLTARWLTDSFSSLVSASHPKRKVREFLDEALRRFCLRTGLPFEECGCTLLAAAIKENTLLTLHIGDGFLFGLGEETFFPLSLPENGDARNITSFVNITLHGLESIRLSVRSCEGLEAVVLTSDGASDFLEQMPQYLFALATFAQEGKGQAIQSFVDAVAKSSVTADDCSVAVLSFAKEELKNTSEEELGEEPKETVEAFLPSHSAQEADNPTAELVEETTFSTANTENRAYLSMTKRQRRTLSQLRQKRSIRSGGRRQTKTLVELLDFGFVSFSNQYWTASDMNVQCVYHLMMEYRNGFKGDDNYV